MKNKKKFYFDLENDLKPDLAYLVEQSEKEFTEYAQKIYDTEVEAIKEDFRIEDLYHTPKSETENSTAADDFMSILEKARLEAIEQASKIFKNEE